MSLMLRLMCDIPGQSERKATFLLVYLSHTLFAMISLSAPS
jgi:hypothetical protein